MAMPGMNSTGTPDAIDSTDYVMTIIRAIRRFPSDRRKEIESIKVESKTAADAKNEEIYQKGYLAALRDIDAFIATVARGI